MTTPTLAPAPALPAVPIRIARPRLRPRFRTLPSPALPRGAHVLSVLAVVTLVTGVLISIVTTSDPLWWQLYFSQLGTFGDFSARMFNGSVMVSGILFASYGATLGAELPVGVGRRTRHALRISLVSIGANMVAIGLIPIPVSQVLHDLAAMGLALSLIALLCAGFGLRRKTYAVRIFLIVGAVVLIGGMVVLTLDLITLALYEAIAFSTLGVWLRLLPGITALQPAPAAVGGIRSTMEEWPTPLLAPSPSRSNDGSTRIAPSRRPVGCRPARILRPASKDSSARAGSAPARAAISGTCSTASATSRPSRRGRTRPSGRGGSTRAARSLARFAWSVAPASRVGSTPRSLTSSSRAARRETPRRDLFSSRSPRHRRAGSRR